MRRTLIIAALATTSVLGFTLGFAHLAYGHRWHEARRARFEAHVADVCVEAARRVERGPQTHEARGRDPRP